MGRSPCCSKEDLNKGAWTAMEDKLLISYIKAHGEGQWRNLPMRAGLKRCGKSCRLRWLNYLRPDIKRGNISHDEEQLIIRLHNLLGNRWSLIAGRLPGRTDNEIKNYWNTTLGKKAKAQASINEPPPRKSTQTECRGAAEPSSSSRTTKAKTEVIRTRATRCSSQVMFPLRPPPSQDIDVTNLTLLQGPIDQEMGDGALLVEAHSGTPVLDSLYSDLLKASDGEFEEPFDEAMFKDWTGNLCLNDNAATTDIDELRDGRLTSTNDRVMCDGATVEGQVLDSLNTEVNELLKASDGEFEEPFDEAMFKDWTANPCLNDTSTVGLESLAFLLDDPDEWESLL
ncbi:hypothetical protein HRI_003166800 [Hibiscus trionum]|uniref:Myb-related protein 123 n=1 Tax=Hibiscus trionum TaxID=183268 RepID=A0A9W7IHT1_HIBTR|nr:hypothetical protein HRI_003166800 [Hibiscus trionum]